MSTPRPGVPLGTEALYSEGRQTGWRLTLQTRDFTLHVNGWSQRVQARPDEPLLWVLRDQLRLTGAKFGCGEGMCGACSVLINGRAQRTCRLAVSAVADGREIITIEGLGKPGDLSRVQKAFAEHTAFGCGYCTPGQIVAATALLDRNPSPTEAQIVSAMDGHLCRCAAYPNILAAVESLARDETQAAGTGPIEGRTERTLPVEVPPGDRHQEGPS